MSIKRPSVDLTGTSYDPLETELTQFLGLKVFLVRGWSGAGPLNQAETNLAFARTPEAHKEAKEEYVKAKEDMLASLRKNIAARDPSMGAEITDGELFALQQQGHITLRNGNVEPEHAVIVFDPVSTPSTPLFSIGISSKDQSEETKVFNFVAKAPVATDDLSAGAAIEWAFRDKFENWWAGRSDHEAKPNVRDLVENFDIGMEDIRRYEALKNVSYALKNQQENKKLQRNDPGAPLFLHFADLVSYDNKNIHSKYYNLPYSAALQEASTEEDWGHRFGLKDKDFFEKLKLSGAVMNLVWNNLKPNNTFARMSSSYKVNDKEIESIMNDVKDGLEKKFEKEHQKYWANAAFDDWRFMFPFFREFYEADKSTGPKREYLDTIMAGLQKWFPTLTNAPVPDLAKDKEPPRSLQKKTPAKRAHKPKNQP